MSSLQDAKYPKFLQFFTLINSWYLCIFLHLIVFPGKTEAFGQAAIAQKGVYPVGGLPMDVPLLGQN